MMTVFGLPHLRPMNIDRLGRIDLSVLKYVETDKGHRLAAGDILFNNTNSRALVGKTALFDRSGDYAYSNHMTRLRPPDGIDAKFLALQLHHQWALGFFREIASNHVNQASVSSGRLLEAVSARIPPLTEQRRIVVALDEQLSRFSDAATAALRRAAAEVVARLRSSVLWTSFAGLGPELALVELTAPNRPICYGILKPRTSGDLVVPYVEVRSIRNGRIDAAALPKTTEALHQEFLRSELRPGDVVLAIRGSFDRAAVVPGNLIRANVSRDVARISPGDRIDSAYLALYLGSPGALQYFARNARGVGVRGVNIGDLRRMPVPAPSLAQQRRIVADLERQLSVIDEVGTAIDATQRRGSALRRSILERAFRGSSSLRIPPTSLRRSSSSASAPSGHRRRSPAAGAAEQESRRPRSMSINQ